MSKGRVTGILSLIVASLLLVGFGKYQNQQIDRKQLREMLAQLGYEIQDIVKDAGKEKYSSKFTRDGLDIPIGYEISPSNTYIWLTVNLGSAPTEGSPKTLALLKQNSKIQPTFFYITDSGRLMAALPVENRAVTNAVLRLRSEALADNVGKTKDVWQK
jgi:hypothetical protein